MSTVLQGSIEHQSNKCAFPVTSVINNPCSKRGRVIEIIALFWTVFIKDQHDLREVAGSFSSEINW